MRKSCGSTRNGLATRDIQAQIQQWYGVEVSPQLISNVTEAVMDEVRQWRSRPLERLYPILSMDCLVVKVKENQRVINKAIYLALGVNLEGQKELLGMWISQNEGAKFWLAVCTELSNRGMKDGFIACVDGLTGLPEAIETVFPPTQVHVCMVHLVRHSLKYVQYKLRKEVARDLKAIDSAATVEEAEFQLEVVAERWDQQYPAISRAWRAHWDRVTPLFAFPDLIRRAISTTTAIESVNRTLRKVTQAHKLFPSDEAVYKVLYLAWQSITTRWTAPISNWKLALNWFALAYSERMKN